MTNDERIAQWRARRDSEVAALEAHGGLPHRLAIIAVEGEELAGGQPDNGDAILSLVLRSLRSEPNSNNAERRAVYDAIARGLDIGLERNNAHADFAELRRRQLRAIVRLIEGDVRDGATLADPAYQPAGVTDALDPLVAGYERRRRRSDEEHARRARRQAVLADEAYAVAIPAEEVADLAYLRRILAMLDATRSERLAHPGHPNLRALAALFRHELVILRNESRLALIWSLLGPAVLLALISSIYFLSGTRSILDMDVASFAMIGATTWIMFRNIIFRSSTAFYSQRYLLNLRQFRPAVVGMMQGFLYIALYMVVYVVLITAGYLADLFTLPNNVPGVVFWVLCMAISGVIVGSIFGSIAVIWPYFLRFAPVLERFLQIFSGVFFVSEQLPAQYRPYMLWSPFAHALQLLRSAYFASYRSEDARPEYFFLCMGVLLVIALIAQKLVHSRSQPM